MLDVRLKGQSGLAFQRTLMEDGGPHMPIIFTTAYGDIPMTVKAMKAGAMDFLAKPFRDQDMIDAVISALERDAARLAIDRQLGETRACWESLTPREREVLQHVADGLMHKQIAASIGIAEITVKIHRGQAMRKMNSRSVAELVRKMEALGIERLALRAIAKNRARRGFQFGERARDGATLYFDMMVGAPWPAVL